MATPKRIIPGMLTKEEDLKIKAAKANGTYKDPVAEQKLKEQQEQEELENSKPKMAKASQGRKVANENIIFVGNLNPSLTSEQLQGYFKVCGDVVNCNIVISKQNKQQLQKQKFEGIEEPEKLSPNFGFIEFTSAVGANMALEQLNEKTIEGYEVQVKKAFKNLSASNASSEPKFNVFVGDLNTDVDDDVLINFFKELEGFVSANVMWDMATGNNRGYGFVTFNTQESAQAAIDAKNGQELNGKAILCNHAAKKEHKPHRNQNQNRPPKRVFNDLPSFFSLQPQHPDEVTLIPPARFFDKRAVANFISRSITPVDNTSVFIGGILDQLHRFVLDVYLNEFFGPIVKTEHFQGYCLATFAYKESAAKCIMGLHKYDVAGLSTLVVYWKKEFVKKPYNKQPQQQEGEQQQEEGEEEEKKQDVSVEDEQPQEQNEVSADETQVPEEQLQNLNI
ncbi:hypothetical protein ACO0SA_001350 [Hanseniaspora valbyensis]